MNPTTTPPEPQAGAATTAAKWAELCRVRAPFSNWRERAFEMRNHAASLETALATSRAETEEARAERDAAKAELVAALVKEGPLNAERWTLDELLVELQKWKAVASGKTCVSFESLCFGASSLWHQTHRENFRKVDLKPASLSKWVLDYVGCIESDFPAQVLKILTTLRAQLAQREAEVEHWKNEMNQLPALVKARTERDTALARVRELEAVMLQLNALVSEWRNRSKESNAMARGAFDTGHDKAASAYAGARSVWSLVADALEHTIAAAARAAGTGEEGQ